MRSQRGLQEHGRGLGRPGGESFQAHPVGRLDFLEPLDDLEGVLGLVICGHGNLRAALADQPFGPEQDIEVRTFRVDLDQVARRELEAARGAIIIQRDALDGRAG